jgi:hypothetical protein
LTDPSIRADALLLQGDIDPMNSEELRQQVIASVKSILAGEIDTIEGCRRVIYAYRSLELAPTSGFLTVLAVESELDDVPSEGQRSLWEPRIFEAKQREKQAYLERVRPQLVTACESLLAQFSEMR